MKNALLGFVMVVCAVPGLAAPPTAASIEKLLEVSRAHAVVDSLQGPIEQNMRAALAQASQGKPMTAEQQRALDAALVKVAAVIRSEVTYEKFKPIYVKIYGESLDQAEVDGMIAFYETPAGQAVLSKMPLIAQKSMAAVREMMATLMPRIQAAAVEAAQAAPKSQ